MLFIIIGSSLAVLKSSLTDISKDSCFTLAKVSFLKGSKLVITRLSKVTLACGKLLIKLKFTSLNSTFALTLLLIKFLTKSFI